MTSNRQQWVYDALGGNTAVNRFNARMALRELGAVRFTYIEQYAINLDQMILRVTGSNW